MEPLNEEILEKVTGGVIVEDGDKYWLVRQTGVVISSAPTLKQAKDFLGAYGENADVISLADYKRKFGRDLIW